MTWEDLSPAKDEYPDALTTAEVATRWNMGDTQARQNLKSLESTGRVKRVKVPRRDIENKIYYCWAWVIIDEPKETAR